VLIGDDGGVRVTDFGVARLVEGETTAERTLAITLTRPGMLVGTPAYMAPEQLEGDRITAAADQFAFCVTAYELVYGVRPFRRVDRRASRRDRAPATRSPRSVRVPAEACRDRARPGGRSGGASRVDGGAPVVVEPRPGDCG
jgi:serine/threonine protein kinase